MKIKILKMLCLILCLIFQLPGRSQSSMKDYPIIGKLMPKLKLTNVHYYVQETFDPREVSGKWVIMDFWEKRCTSCVQSFPKVNQLQNEFKDHIQFILVAKNDKKYNRNIELIFDKYRKTLGLQLPIAFDSAIFDQFGIQGVPHVIIIDPQANVYAVTYGEFLNRENLRNLIENNRPTFKTKYSTFEQERIFYEDQWRYLIDDNKEVRDFIYRSIISKNSGERSIGSSKIDQYTEQGFFQITRTNLYQLYNIAYLGESEWDRGSLYASHWTYPVLEVDDSSSFHFNYANNDGFYNYSLIVPKEKATKKHLMEVMQRDLENYFGYEVSLETRMMPYWKLTATEEAKKNLRAKGKYDEFKSESIGIEAKGITAEFILALIKDYNDDEYFPFIDETNIRERIDIMFNAVMTDMNDVKKALSKHGLILEKSKKEMKVLVIKDPVPIIRNN